MDAGTIVAGKYRLISLVGEGGMGSVWRAEHLGLHAPVAVKLLGSSMDASPVTLDRFHREAQAAAALRSPHVVQILDYGVDEGTRTPFIIMELLEGETLAERLLRVRQLSPAETARMVVQVARALGRAHELGIVHRDLKPGNIFLVRNDDEEFAKVLDFGVAKWRAPSSLSTTDTATVVGTPLYMSPEQLMDGRNIDHRADLWALGAIACECLTGRRPFEAERPMSAVIKACGGFTARNAVNVGLPEAFVPWMSRALASDAGARFESARQMAEELRRICRDLPPPAALGPWGTLIIPCPGGAPGAPPSAQAAPSGAVQGREGEPSLGVSGRSWRPSSPREAELASLLLQFEPMAGAGARELNRVRSSRPSGGHALDRGVPMSDVPVIATVKPNSGWFHRRTLRSASTKPSRLAVWGALSLLGLGALCSPFREGVADGAPSAVSCSSEPPLNATDDVAAGAVLVSNSLAGALVAEGAPAGEAAPVPGTSAPQELAPVPEGSGGERTSSIAPSAAHEPVADSQHSSAHPPASARPRSSAASARRTARSASEPSLPLAQLAPPGVSAPTPAWARDAAAASPEQSRAKISPAKLKAKPKPVPSWLLDRRK